jgi:tetratricopeptide (TPR) repeat protein
VDEAIACFKKAMALDPKNGMAYLKLAALQAWFGQDKELAATRQRILAFAKDTSDVFVAQRAARACGIRGTTDKAEHEAALALARKAVEAGKGGEWNLLALGMAEYRSGNDAAAEEALRAAAKAGPGNPQVTGISAFYRANEASKVASEAVIRMKPLPADEQNPLAGATNHDDLILWLAYKEAKAMIQFDASPPPKGKAEEKADQNNK